MMIKLVDCSLGRTYINVLTGELELQPVLPFAGIAVLLMTMSEGVLSRADCN